MDLTALPLSKPGQMTAMDSFIFECFGYIVIEDVLTEAECEETLDAAIRLHQGHPKTKLLQLGKGFEHEPAIERLMDHPAVLPKVRALLGDNFVLQAAWCTVQPAGSQSVGWHQDGSSAFDFKKLGYPDGVEWQRLVPCGFRFLPSAPRTGQASFQASGSP